MRIKTLVDNRCIFYVLAFVLLIPFLMLRDYTPANELRYLSIAKEALYNGSIFTFYNHGELYADKPPLFFWLLMIFEKLSLKSNLLVITLFSLLPSFITIEVMCRWLKPYLSKENIITGQYLLFTTAYFFASSVILRMDILMCMFITLSLYTFFKMYNGDLSIKNRLLFPLFIFLSLFSKGPLGVILPIASIFLFLIITKKIKDIGKYLGWWTWTSLLLLFAIWMLLVYNEGGYKYIDNLLFHQTIGRAVNAFHHKKSFFYYFINIWYVLSPWVFFYVTLIFISIKKRLINSDIKKFFVTIIFVSIIILSFISSKLSIYLLPIIPFVSFLSLLLFQDINANKYVKYGLAIPNIIFVLIFPLLIIFQTKFPFEVNAFLFLGTIILSAFAILSLFLLKKEEINLSIISSSIGVLSFMFFMGLFFPSINTYLGYSTISKELEKKIDNNHNIKIMGYKLKNIRDIDYYIDKNISLIDNDNLNRIDFSDKNLMIITDLNKLNKDTLLKSKTILMKRDIKDKYIILTNINQ